MITPEEKYVTKKDHQDTSVMVSPIAIKRMDRRWRFRQCYDDNPSCGEQVATPQSRQVYPILKSTVKETPVILFQPPSQVWAQK
jgi:hypothetical protein